MKLAVVRLVSAGAPSSSAVGVPSEEAVFGTALECATVTPMPKSVPRAKVMLGARTLGVAVIESRLAGLSASSAKVVRVGQILGWPGVLARLFVTGSANGWSGKEIRRRWTVTFRVVLAVPCISLGLKCSLFLSRPLLPLGSKIFPLILECRIFSPDIVDDPQLALFVRDEIQKSCVDFFFFLNLC